MDLSGLRRVRAAARSALRGLRATPLIFMASSGTLAAGLLLLGVYLLILQNMHSVLDHAGDDLTLVAYFEPSFDPGDGELGQFLDRVRALEGVGSVRFISADDALVQLRRALGAEASLVDDLHRNPLPASVQVGPKANRRSAADIRALAQQLSAMPRVEDVRYGVEWVEGYTRVLRAARWVGLLLGAFLVLVLGAIVAGTVRLAVHSRQEEIRIQRLVGANTLFVRLPFYIEGFAQGAVAASVAAGLLYALYVLGLPLLGEPLRFLLGHAEVQFLGAREMLLLLGVGVGLGLGGTAVSLVQVDEEA